MRTWIAMVLMVTLLVVGFTACVDGPVEPTEEAVPEMVDVLDTDSPLFQQTMTCEEHCDNKRDFICVASYQPWQQCTFETTWGCSCEFTGYQRDAPGGSYPY